MANEFQKVSGDYRKAGNESFGSMVRSVGEVSKGLQAISEEVAQFSKNSVNRAIEMQAQLAKKAFEAWISELSKLSQMGFVGYDKLVARAEDIPRRLGNDERRGGTHRGQATGRKRTSASRNVQSTAAQRAATHKKVGTAKSSGPKRRSKSKT
jgi:hypothetical protein